MQEVRGRRRGGTAFGRRCAVGMLVWAAWWVPVAAPAAEEGGERSLGTVVVTATRTAQPLEQATTSISVITADDIASRRGTAVTDALRDVPGVTVTQLGSTGTSASVLIRGADADQTLVLVDGVELNSPTLGEFNFGTLTTDNVERIEVLRGAGGTLYGSEAVGGVVNILTKAGEGPPRFSVTSEGGSGDTHRHRFAASGARGGLGFAGAVAYQTTGGFRPVNDDYTNVTGSLRLDAGLVERGTLRGFFRFQDSSLGLFNNLNFLVPFAPDPNARFSEERYLFKGEWEHQVLDALTYRIAGSVVHEAQTYTDPDAAEFFTQRSEIPSQITSGEAQATYYAGAVGITTAGFEFKEKEARPKTWVVGLDGGLVEGRFSASRSIYAGYFQQQILLLDERLIGTGGFRVDADEGFGTEVSAAWSVGYEFREVGLRVHGGYSEGFKAPTFNELFFPLFGNPDLDAETSREYNGGVEQRLWDDIVTVDATYFDRRTSNLIQGVPDPEAQGGFKAANAGRVDAGGVETGVTVRPWRDLAVRGSYMYLDFDVVGGAGTLLRRPHNSMAASARYHRGGLLQDGDAVDLVTDVTFTGDRSDVEPTTFGVARNAASTVTDVAVTYAFSPPAAALERVAVFARVNNLFDRKYQEALGFPAPPLSAVAGAEVTF